ncbi:uncharacterized protein LOC116347297 [Contarinia nasturtii]|uniref:uncharacterized protein LOC116347297 n=1 Tax=Contarinia nasturtii TaxID=265458 RepID=UPI0012D3B71A|nr:uncharacterized protein LOC116347297 [Contarinia nasturtii]
MSLNNIRTSFKHTGLSVNQEFKRYFLSASNDRISRAYDHFETNSMSEGQMTTDADASMSTADGTQSMDWNDKMSKMLNFLEQQVLRSLNNIRLAFNHCNSTFNPTFKEYFLHVSNARLVETYNRFEIHSQNEDEMMDYSDAIVFEDLSSMVNNSTLFGGRMANNKSRNQTVDALNNRARIYSSSTDIFGAVESERNARTQGIRYSQ